MKVFFGWCLMAVGGLIALTCGLCTLGFVAVGVISWVAMIARGGVAGLLGGFHGSLLVVLIGGLPTLVGVGIFMAGWNLARRRDGVLPRGGEQ